MNERFSRGDFLEALFREYFEDEGKFILVRSTRNMNAGGNVGYYPSVESLAAAKFPDDMHVFFGPCPREKMNPAKEHVRFVTALWAGLDRGPECFSGPKGCFPDTDRLAEAIACFPLKPSAVVRSGRGTHLYWFLQDIKTVFDISPFEALLSRINRHFGCGTFVGIDSTLRLPGTMNPRYYGTEKYCRIEHLDPSLRYRGRDFRTLKVPPAAATTDPVGHEPRPEHVVHFENSRVNRSITGAEAAYAAGPNMPEPEDEVPEESAEATYEEVLETVCSPGSGPSEDALELLADKLADKLGVRIADDIAESVSDRIVERTVEKLLDELTAVSRVK
jgi:hypothetical protein